MSPSEAHRTRAVERLCLAFKATSDAQRAELINEALEEHECAVVELVRLEIEHGRMPLPHGMDWR